MNKYQAKCIEEGGDSFYYVGVGDADICHTGNGPTSDANAKRIVDCVNACAGIKDPEKTIPLMVEALDKISGFRCAWSGDNMTTVKRLQGLMDIAIEALKKAKAEEK